MSHANQLITALGQSAGLGAALQLNPQGCACLTVDNHLSLHFEEVAATGTLQIYCIVGTVPATGRELFYQQLLVANLFGAETAGATLGLDLYQQKVVLSLGLEIETTTTDKLQQVVEQFITTAAHWKERIVQYISGMLAAPLGASVNVAGRIEAVQYPDSMVMMRV